MRKVIKEGTKVKIKRGLESLRDELGRINGLYCDLAMYEYEGQELEVSTSWWDRTSNQNYFSFNNIYWTWNLSMIEEVGEENMRDLDRVCQHCGRELEEGEELTYIEEYDRYVCNDCRDNNYSVCDDCGRLTLNDDIYSVEGGDRHVCESCFSDYYECGECHEYHYRDNMNYDEDTDEYYCDYCWDNRPEHRVLGYSEEHDTTEWIEYRLPSDDPNCDLMGTETESENYTGDTSMIDRLYDNLNVVLARDGSLHCSNSFETITMPQSMGYFKSQVGIVKELYDEMVEKGYRSDKTDTCGLHVHVTRPFVNEINNLEWNDPKRAELIEKQEEVINRIILVMETFKEELLRFSRRKDTYWCKWLSDVVNEGNKITSLDFIKKVKGESMGHHRALNLENDRTIEFRIFKGTLNYKTYYATLELVDNIMKYCKDLSYPLEKITWNKLTEGEFVKDYVIERGIKSNRRVIDTTEVDKIWEIIKNKRKSKVAKKIMGYLNKYYNIYTTRFNDIKDSEDWYAIQNVVSRIREFVSQMENAQNYYNNKDYNSLVYKVKEMTGYYMYFDTLELEDIRSTIRDLIKGI